jgi:integrase-like protein
MGIRDKPTAPASPWQNSFAERLIGSIRRECLDHVIVLGEAHLRRILKSYARYYNETRTHLALEGCSPVARRKEGRAYSLPPGPRRIASRICPDLISDRHKYRSVNRTAKYSAPKSVASKQSVTNKPIVPVSSGAEVCAVGCVQMHLPCNKTNKIIYLMDLLAEGVGFEPTVPLQARRFSRPVP